MTGESVFDVAIIGGGIVGCAVLRELTDRGYHCVLLEKEADLASGATGGNSAHLLHNPSLFEQGGSPVESECIMSSAGLWEDIMTQYDLPRSVLEAIMIACNSNELDKLRDYVIRAHENGVRDVKLLSTEEVLALEPNLNTGIVKGGLLVGGETMIDSNLVAVTLAHSALRQGAKIECSSEVRGARQREDGVWELQRAGGVIAARHVINAAGLYGDRVETIAGNTPKFTIKPRKGQFAVFNKAAGSLINHMILPVPSETTKGIIIFTSVYGNLVVGPTAEETEERMNPSIEHHTVSDLIRYAQQFIPALKGAESKGAESNGAESKGAESKEAESKGAESKGAESKGAESNLAESKEAACQVIGSYAGIRPATAESKDYHIYATLNKKWITVGGIRSTGQTACLGIAKRVADLLTSELLATPSRSPARSRSRSVAWVTERPSYVLDGAEYNVRHPLMKLGLLRKHKAAKL